MENRSELAEELLRCDELWNKKKLFGGFASLFFLGVFSWFLIPCYIFDLLESHILITADSELLKAFFTMESRWQRIESNFSLPGKVPQDLG